MSYQTTFTTALIHAIVTAKKIDPPPRRADRVQWLADYGYEWTGAAYERLGDVSTPEWASPVDNPYHRVKCDCDARNPAIAVIVCVWRDSVCLDYAVCGECLIWERFNRDEIDIATARRLIHTMPPLESPCVEPRGELAQTRKKKETVELLDYAERMAEYVKSNGLTWREAERKLGFARNGLRHIQRTGELPDYLKAQVRSGELSASRAREIVVRERIKTA